MAVWQEKRLGEVAEIVSGGTPDTNNFEFWGGNIGWITPFDLSNYNYRYICNGTRNITDSGLANSSAKLLPSNTILFSSRAPIGYIAIAKNPLTTNQGFKNLICKNINYLFLYYYLKYNVNYLKLYATGATFPELSATTIKKIKINIPDLATQEKIADILSAYDDLIENNNRRIEILEQMAQEIYKEWFVRFRFPGHKKVKYKTIKMTNWIFGNDPITMIPNSWHIGNVSELDLFKRGSNLTSAKMINGDIPVISAGIQPSGYHNVANVFGQSITVSASGANAGYLLYHLNDIWASDCSYLQSEYIWFIYNSLKFLQPVLNNLQCGAAQPHVYPKQINKIHIIIPTNEILKQYCSKVEPIYEHIKNLKEKNQNLIKQRDLLLPRLMSGKLEV